MPLQSFPRLLFASFMFAVIATGAMTYTAVANSTTNRTDTTSRENVPVQTCGDVPITSSYTVTRTSNVVEDYPGHEVVERRQVTFSGALGNATAGNSFRYDGHFTRTADYDQGQSQITDLFVRFEIGTPGEFSYSLAK